MNKRPKLGTRNLRGTADYGARQRDKGLLYFAKLWPSFRPLAVGGERWIVAELDQIWVSFAGMSGGASRGDVIVTRICTEPPVAASIGTGAIEGGDPRMLWEMLMLEGFQAGLAWIIILRKREAFRKAFANFDPVKVAAFTEADVARLMADPGIVRAQAKIRATITDG